MNKGEISQEKRKEDRKPISHYSVWTQLRSTSSTGPHAHAHLFHLDLSCKNNVEDTGGSPIRKLFPRGLKGNTSISREATVEAGTLDVGNHAWRDLTTGHSP